MPRDPFQLPADLATARILVSNDDGVHAPGIKALERIARAFSEDVWVVAPEVEQSAASHSLTIHAPLRLREYGPRVLAVNGTPTDSVLLGVNFVLKDRRPDLVLSGVNLGSNLADDVTYSGTVAAAMEATLLGVPAIAFSQAPLPDGGFDWSVAERWAPEVLRRLAGTSWPPGVLINVNFPAVPAERVTGIRLAPCGKYRVADQLDVRVDPRGRRYFWIGPLQEEEGPVDETTDIGVVAGGGIAVTPLCLDMTHHASLDALAGAF